MVILGEVARGLNGGFIAASAFFFSTVALSFIFSGVLSGIQRASARFRERVLWAIGLFPWLAALGIACIVLWPALVSVKPAWLSQLTHWHHAELFDLYSWHILPVGLFMMAISRAVIASSLMLFGHLKKVAVINQWLVPEGSNTETQTFSMGAFTYGFLRPRIFISSELKKALSEAECNAIWLHEQAHVKRRDPLRKFCFSFLCYFFPGSVARKMQQEFALTLEQTADAAAVSGGAQNALVAKTLLKVYRLNHRIQSPSLCAFSDSAIAARVHYLMTPGRQLARYYASAGLIFVSLFALCLVGIDSFHHSVEQLFQH